MLNLKGRIGHTAAGLAAGILAAGGGGAVAAVAAHTDAPKKTTATKPGLVARGVITACVNSKTHAVLIEAKCPHGYNAVTWTQKGIQGAPGAAGAPGARGAAGTSQTVTQTVTTTTPQQVLIKTGAQGPPGTPGATVTGPQGATGATGAPGAVAWSEPCTVTTPIANGVYSCGGNTLTDGYGIGPNANTQVSPASLITDGGSSYVDTPTGLQEIAAAGQNGEPNCWAVIDPGAASTTALGTVGVLSHGGLCTSVQAQYLGTPATGLKVTMNGCPDSDITNYAAAGTIPPIITAGPDSPAAGESANDTDKNANPLLFDVTVKNAQYTTTTPGQSNDAGTSFTLIGWGNSSGPNGVTTQNATGAMAVVENC